MLIWIAFGIISAMWYISNLDVDKNSNKIIYDGLDIACVIIMFITGPILFVVKVADCFLYVIRRRYLNG